MAKIDQKFHKNSKLKFNDHEDDWDFNLNERKKSRRVARQRDSIQEKLERDEFSDLDAY